MHPIHPLRILHRNQSDRRLAIDAELMKSLEIGLNARAAAWIGPGDGERDWLPAIRFAIR